METMPILVTNPVEALCKMAPLLNRAYLRSVPSRFGWLAGQGLASVTGLDRWYPAQCLKPWSLVVLLRLK